MCRADRSTGPLDEVLVELQATFGLAPRERMSKQQRIGQLSGKPMQPLVESLMSSKTVARVATKAASA